MEYLNKHYIHADGTLANVFLLNDVSGRVMEKWPSWLIAILHKDKTGWPILQYDAPKNMSYLELYRHTDDKKFDQSEYQQVTFGDYIYHRDDGKWGVLKGVEFHQQYRPVGYTKDKMNQIAGQIDPYDSTYYAIPLWCVYGPVSAPTVICCKLHERTPGEVNIWGYSLYKGEPGFRTLGVNRESFIAREHTYHAYFFDKQENAMAYLSKILTPKL